MIVASLEVYTSSIFVCIRYIIDAGSQTAEHGSHRRLGCDVSL